MKRAVYLLIILCAVVLYGAGQPSVKNEDKKTYVLIENRWVEAEELYFTELPKYGWTIKKIENE